MKLILLISALYSISAFQSVIRSGQKRTLLRMSSTPSLSGKVAVQRFLYRLSPTRSKVQSPYAIEERQYFKVAEDKSVEPLGSDRTFILRKPVSGVQSTVEPPSEEIKKNGLLRTYTQVGPAAYSIKKISEAEEEDDLGGSVWDSSFALALYCAAHPEFIKGRGMELGAGVGLGGLLSTIFAGIAMEGVEGASSKDKGYQSIEEIANSPVATVDEEDAENTKLSAPVPPELSRILFSDSHDNILRTCLSNIETSGFPIGKVEVGVMDWKNRVRGDMTGKFDFILGSDIAYYFPLVEPLARTVAYTLKSSPYDRKENTQLIRGKFLHVGPQHRESIEELKRKLGRGYKFNTGMEDIVMERFDLVPLFLDSIDDEDDNLKDEVEGPKGGYVEYQNIDTSKFSALVGYHNEDYDGFNGDFFFPAETGKETRYGDRGMETQYDTDASTY